MGHKIGMVSDASGSLPDKKATFYDDSKGLVGPHSHHAIPVGQTRHDSAADAKNMTVSCISQPMLTLHFVSTVHRRRKTGY
jgi:hypothetical protein